MSGAASTAERSSSSPASAAHRGAGATSNAGYWLDLVARVALAACTYAVLVTVWAAVTLVGCWPRKARSRT